MRSKKAGTPPMDFNISPDDRVGAPIKGRGKATSAKGRAKAAPKRGGRVEPGFSESGEVFVDDDRQERGRRQRGKAPKARGRGKREKRPLTLGRVIMRLVGLFFMLGIWATLAGAAVVAYFAFQLPASDTWKVPDRPPNIRIVAADGQLISNRGKSGGEAVNLRELPYYVPAAFVSIEDRRFYEHFGIDVLAATKA